MTTVDPHAFCSSGYAAATNASNRRKGCVLTRLRLLLLWALATGCAERAERATIDPDGPYIGVAKALERFISHEMADKQLPGLSIALVDDQRIVWARGFGIEHMKDSTPATAQTVYRVGSVSKLFTDIAVMQLVERGKLSLDAPVTTYLPDFTPANGFGEAITLRELMSHRSGLVREPPVGHYFDDTSPSLEATVASLNTTALVYAPRARTKYSNAAIATVGYVLEKVQNEPFPSYLKRTVLAPMGLRQSGFEPEPTLVRHLADGKMWTYHGRTFPAPTFQLGMAPAGSMYATMPDLAHFMSVLFAGGKGIGGQVLKSASLDSMWTPQFAVPGAKAGYGIGFAIGDLDGERVVRHGGAIMASLPRWRLSRGRSSASPSRSRRTGRTPSPRESPTPVFA